MLGFAWLEIRQAQEALLKGRLEDAQRLLGQPCLQGHKRSFDLLRQLARAYVERGERHLRHDNPEAAWADLLQAEQMSVADCGAERLRKTLVRAGGAEVRALLQAGEPARADEACAQLRQRLVRGAELDLLEEAARSWLEARELAARGEFAAARENVNRLCRLQLAPAGALELFRRELEDRQPTFGALLARLHEAAEAGRWREVVEAAERVLAVAPHHGEARRLRSRAWRAIEPVTVAGRRQPEPPTSAAVADLTPPRFLLWIDGVGGYLVCMGKRITIGQATSETYVDVPLFADVSRLHAALTRDEEGYLLEALRPVQVNGRAVERVLLRPDDRLNLGDGCQVRFRQPAPVSASARLDLTSGHRLPLSVDAVLLMADTLLLGPGTHVHVELPECKNTVVLFRHKDGLGVRCGGELTVNGERCKDRGLLGSHASVAGDDFAFAVEAVGTRLMNSGQESGVRSQ